MRVPATLYAGVLSGVAHPVLDLAHFGFLLALAVLALRSAQPLRLLAIFLAAVLVGAGAHLAGIEPLEGQGLAGWMAATALLGGLVIALPPRGRPSAIAASIALAVAGLLHGSGYAESVEGASLPVLAAYFTGVFVVQSAIALAGVQALRLAATKGRLDVGEGALASIALVCGGVAMTMAIAA